MLDMMKSINLEKLKKLINYYEAEVNELTKLDKMCRICSNSTEFKNIYLESNSSEFFKQNKIKIINMYNFYKRNEINGSVSLINHYLQNETFYECYKYAKFVINAYIDDKSPTFSLFLNKIGIESDTFQFCVDTIEELDIDLYRRFLKNNKEKSKQYLYGCYYNIKNIIHGIKTGKLLNGTNFNEYVFWYLVPFKERRNFEQLIRDYVERNFYQDYLIFLSYFAEITERKRKDRNKNVKKVLIP